MTNPDDPAVQEIRRLKANEEGHYANFHVNGLTKREYFAAMSFAGICVLKELRVEEVAKLAVLLADALIDELNRSRK